MWRIAAAEAAQYDASQFGCLKHVSYDVLLYAREQREYHYVGVHCEMWYHRFGEVAL